MEVSGPTSSESRPTSYAWLVVGLLWFVALLNYLDRLMITTMREPIRADIPMSDAQFGLLTSVFLWVYAAMSPVGGFVADRFGRRGVICASLFFWSVATCISGVAATHGQMLAARALMGLSEACYIPAALALIADYHRGRTRSLATGLHVAGIYAGAALGGVGGYIAESFGWRVGFKLFGGIGIVYCVVLLLLLRDAPQSEDVSFEKKAKARSGEGVGAILASLVRQPGFWVLLGVNVLIGVVNWAVYGWLPTFLRDRFHLGLGAAGMSATAYIQVASFAGVLAAGAIADRWSARNRRARAIVPALGYLMAGPCLIAAASADALPVAIAGLIVFGLGRGAFDANQMPLLREIIDERYSATGYGVLNLISTMCGGLMVYIGGAMVDANVDLARLFQAAGAGTFVAGLLLLAIRVRAARKNGGEPSEPLAVAGAAALDA